MEKIPAAPRTAPACLPVLILTLGLSIPLPASPEDNPAHPDLPGAVAAEASLVPDAAVLLAFSGIVASLAQGPEARLDAFFLFNLGLRRADREALLDAARRHLAYVDSLTEEQRLALCADSLATGTPDLASFVARSAAFDDERNLKSLAFFHEHMGHAAGRANLGRILDWADRRIRPSLASARFDAEGFLRDQDADVAHVMAVLCGPRT